MAVLWTAIRTPFVNKSFSEVRKKKISAYLKINQNKARQQKRLSHRGKNFLQTAFLLLSYRFSLHISVKFILFHF